MGISRGPKRHYTSVSLFNCDKDPATKPALLSWGGGGGNPSEARCLYDRAKRGCLHQGCLGGGGAVSPPPPNGAGAELRKILNFSASRTPNIVFPGHLRTKILSFIKRKIRRISITQLLSCIIITNDTYYVQLSVHSLK